MTRILYVDRHWESPYAMSAFVALEEKGLAFVAKELALEKKEQHKSDYRALTSRVPCLVEGDFWLAESSAIAEYLEEMFPPPGSPRIFPEAPKDRAVCREVQAWLRSDLMPIRQERPTTSIFFPEHRAKKPLSAAAQRHAERLVRAGERLIPAGTTHLFGSFSIADIDLGIMLMRLHINGDPLPTSLAHFAEAQWNRPSVQKWVDRVRPPFVDHE
jgi:glutathione S-transferase